MQFSVVSTYSQSKKADLIAIPFWKEKDKAIPACAHTFAKEVKFPLDEQDFLGKPAEVLIFYGAAEKRIALVGLGSKEKFSTEALRRGFGALAKAMHLKKLKSVNVLLPEKTELSEEDLARGVADGVLSANYFYTKLRHDSLKEFPHQKIEKLSLIGAGKSAMAALNKAQGAFDGVYFARDLINGNADDINPQSLVKITKEIAKSSTALSATIFDKKRIEKEKMGLISAVNRGSNIDPALIILSYKGDPKSKDHTVVVGKGITYDTGGLNLKPTGYMETMKSDMSGAAAALGTIVAASQLKLKKNITAVVPATENSIGSKSFKPGDVYRAYSGKTVEIGNTDAEGRLVLADALAYATKNLKPSRIIDFATLTGACVVALGSEASGLMSNNEELAKSLEKAGYSSFERAWRLPLFDEYKLQLKSNIADIKNIGGKEAGTITAAAFLQQFVGDTPWAHIDIAGTAYLEKVKRYTPIMGTGVGVRLMIDFLTT